jgi:c-di-GMP-binding flagellar brake protein YcgR
MDPLTPAAQRRKDKRFKQWNKTTINVLDGGGGLRGASEIKAFTNDLSLGGAQVHTSELIAVGACVKMRIVLARTQDSVVLEGTVKWVKRHPSENVYQIGVEFFHETPQGFMTLMREFFEGRPAAGALKSEEPRINRS